MEYVIVYSEDEKVHEEHVGSVKEHVNTKKGEWDPPLEIDEDFSTYYLSDIKFL
jgi:hypothetical protein